MFQQHVLVQQTGDTEANIRLCGLNVTFELQHKLFLGKK